MIDRNTGAEAIAISTPVYPEWLAAQLPSPAGDDTNAILASAPVADGSRFVIVIRATRATEALGILSNSGQAWARL